MVVTVQAESNMNKAHIKLLKENYEKACEEYLKAFCNAYEIQYDSDAWVAGDVGTIACVGEYYFDFNDVIKYAVDNNLKDWEELMEWYDYTLFAHEFNQSIPNFKSWHKGCPRLSKDAQKHLISLKERLDKTIQEYKENTNTTFDF